jgi:hypothetical protein
MTDSRVPDRHPSEAGHDCSVVPARSGTSQIAYMTPNGELG